MKTYTVKDGDTMTKLAAANKVSKQAIFNANRDRIGSNPNDIRPGMTLQIPDDDAEGGISPKEAKKNGDS